ncbi:MAG: FAD-dependent oxidoreductase [Bacteroidota bacterium]|nr:FAD-dependent oxidoreductase [Bacteroidota bacterium]
MKHVLIIGNGIGGITAARHIRKHSGFRISVISDETAHFFSRTALMYIYMGHMKFEHTKPYEDWFWKKNRIELIKGRVEQLDVKNKMLRLSDQKEIRYDILILAIGSRPNMFGWPGQDLHGVSGFYSYQDLERVEQFTKNISKGVIVGGGLIGVELAEMLHSRNIPVSMLVREERYWGNVLPEEEARMIEKEIRANKIDLRLQTELLEILPDEDGRVKAVKTSTGEIIPCGFVGIATGVHPNIDFLKGSGIETDKGILVDEYLCTNIPDVYAAGDCAQFRHAPPGRKNIEQVWYTGRMQAETLAQTICGNPLKYLPGPWFNSAKFFDVEYQTYGWVHSELRENEEALYWEAGQANKCLKIVFDRKSHEIKGINVFGIRLRHEVCEKWIKSKTRIQEVISSLHIAHFDPEFHKKHYRDIRKEFAKQLNKEELQG